MFLYNLYVTNNQIIISYFLDKQSTMKFFNMKALKAMVVLLALPSTLFAQAWITKHGMTSSQYQNEFNVNAQNGYRLTSVNGYTTNGAERYIALWEKVTGPAMVARHSMTASEYQTAFNTYTKQGYRLTQVSGYAVNKVAQFAAIWEKKSGGAWVARHNMTASQYQSAFNTYAGQGYRLQHINGYVVNGVEYFAAIWEKVSGPAWVARHNLTSSQYQTEFNTRNSQGYVLTQVSGYSKNGVDLYAAIWQKISSPLRYARHGVSAVNYQHVVDNMYYQGYRPVCVNAFASGTSSKFNNIWTNTNMSGSDIAKIDAAASSYMNNQGVTGLSIAVTKDGRLVFAKGYGFANPATKEEMSPNHSMRIMSISKPVTSVGIMTLVQQGKLNLDWKVFGPSGILGSKYPTPVGKEKLNNITVRQMLLMTSGLRTCNGESVFWDASKTVADAMNVLMNASDLISNDVNVAFEYSNTNFFILARVIEERSGLSYENFIRTYVLNKAGIGSKMYVGQANGNPKAGEATYTPLTKMNLQQWDGFGGWVARPLDLVNFLRYVDGKTIPSDILSSTNHTTMTTGSMLNSGYGFGWSVNGSLQSHNGCHGSSRSFLVELAGGISYSVIVNSQPLNDGCGWTMKSTMESGLSGVVSYPSYNLFGSTPLAINAKMNDEESDDPSLDLSFNDAKTTENLVKVFPNPGSGGVINFTNAGDILSVTIADATGRTETYKGQDQINTNLKGVLIVKIVTLQGSIIEKVVMN